MQCNCFEATLDNASEKIKERLPENITELNIDWKDRIFFLSVGEYSPSNPQVEYSYRRKKSNGEPYRSITKDSITIAASYCCFCGRELERNSADALAKCEMK